MLSRLVCRRNRGANGSKNAASSGSASGEALGTLLIFMLHSTTETNKVVLDAVMELSGETLRELSRFATQGRRDRQEASAEGVDGVTASCKGAGNDDPTSTTRVPAQH